MDSSSVTLRKIKHIISFHYYHSHLAKHVKTAFFWNFPFVFIFMEIITVLMKQVSVYFGHYPKLYKEEWSVTST